MMLLTKEVRQSLPGIGETADDPNPMVRVKFFAPWSNWTWYATEFDGKDLFFGYVIGFEAELGYFSLSELTSVNGPFGLKIERDRSFEPCRLEEVKTR